jgi:hypothetical protein
VISRNAFFRFCALVAVIVTFSGCATTRDEPSQEFLEPLSDDSSDLLGQVRFGLPLNESTLLLPYVLDQESPATDAWAASWDELNNALIVMVEYSVDMVDLLQGDPSPASIDPMIDLITELHDKISEFPAAEAHARNLDYASIVSQMRQQESVSDAFALALPEIEFVSDVVRQVIVDNDDRLQEAADELEGKIDTRHGAIRGFGDNLAARRSSTLRLLDLIDRAWTGDEQAWREILSDDWALRSEFGEDARFSPENIKKVEKSLVGRLATLAEIRDHLVPEYREYQAQLKELYQIRAGIESSLGIVNLVVEAWENSQRRLARGEKTGFSKLTASLVDIAYSSATR